MIDPLPPELAETPVSPRRPGFSPVAGSPTPSVQVSIVTPYFEAGPEFRETVLSVQRQSFQAWEWIVVDDKSTKPEALSMLVELARAEPRVRVITHERNAGPGAARNTGFAAARAPYVLQLDCDNLLEPTAIEQWLWFLESHPEFAFVKGYTAGFGAESYLMRGGFHEGSVFLTQNRVDATALVRASAHRDVGGYDESIRGGMEDWDFWLRCANRGLWGSTIPEALDWFRRRASHSDRWPDWDEGERQRAFLDGLRERFPALYTGGFPTPTAVGGEDVARRTSLAFDNPLQKSKPRLLLVVPWFAWGGADAYNLTLIDGLQARGWEVTVVATLSEGHHWEARFRERTADVFVLPRFLRHVDHARFLAYLVHSRQPDAVLLSHSQLAYDCLALFRSLAPQVPVLDYCHVEEPWDDGGYARHSLKQGRYLDLTLVTSQHLLNWMVARGAKPERIGVCMINVDTEHFQSDLGRRAKVRREFALSEKTPLVLFAGRICPQKQPEAVGRALAELARRRVPFHAVVAGDGPDRPWLENDVRRRGLASRVTFVGALSNERVRDLMCAADVLFLPSRWEGIALVLFEALACGLPVVASDVGGQRELVTPDCGFLIAPRGLEKDVDAYAAALATLLQDAELRKTMGRAARERVSTLFPLPKMFDNLLAHLEAARDLSRRSPCNLPTPTEAAEQVQPALALHSRYDGVALRGAGQDPQTSVLMRMDLKARLYRTIYRWHEPLYRFYVQKGWTWMDPVRTKAQRVLLRLAGSNEH